MIFESPSKMCRTIDGGSREKWSRREAIKGGEMSFITAVNVKILNKLQAK
jgi:hypothetical protein